MIFNTALGPMNLNDTQDIEMAIDQLQERLKLRCSCDCRLRIINNIIKLKEMHKNWMFHDEIMEKIRIFAPGVLLSGAVICAMGIIIASAYIISLTS